MAVLMRRVLIVGGTGFLGYHATRELTEGGWEVTALGLPPAPPPDLYPASVKLALFPLEAASDDDLLALLRGHEALVFAAGMDDRVTPRRPAYPKFYAANVAAPLRLFQLAARAGVKRGVVLGSYFAHFDRLWPEMRLAERHPYIRSRVEQENALTTLPDLETCVLELPYIFGRLPFPGWKPLWAPLVQYLRSWPVVFYMQGGTACVSAETVGRAICAAVERGEGGRVYPIGQENLTWVEMLSRLAAADGRQVRVVTLPKGLVAAGLWGGGLWHAVNGLEGGLSPRYFAALQTAHTYLEAEASERALGYQPASLEEAFRQTVQVVPERNRARPV